MSEVETTPAKQNNPQNKNVLEKLIKLDKKNSQINVFDPARGMKAIAPSSAGQTEQNLRNFWRHINQYYFKKIDMQDLERIDYLTNLLNVVLKDSEIRYSDPNAYAAFKKLVSAEYKNLHKDIDCDKQNLRNLQMQYRLSTLLHPLTNNFSNKKIAKQSQKILDAQFDFQAPKKKDVSSVLATEAKHLEKLIEEADEIEIEDGAKGKEQNKPNEVADELDKLMDQYKDLSKTNLTQLKELKKKVSGENWSLSMSCDKSGATPLESGSINRENLLMTKKQQLETTRVIETQIKYLKHMLISLENRQAAEAIKCVIDYGKDPEDGKYKFLVIFDEALLQKEVWLEEEVLDDMDKLREQSLFKVHNIAHKTSRSLSAGNLIAFHYINEKVKKKNLVIKEKAWKDLIKKKVKEKFDGFSRDTAATKLKEFGLCHHCKNLFPSEHMVKCNYRSSVMGLPTITPSLLDPVAHDRQHPKASPKRTVYTNKRSVYSFYTRRSGELFCTRKFCRICLKQNYDLNVGEVAAKADWVCPFCNGSCYCSRCLRNEHLNKLAGVYLLLGGDVSEIRAESYLEKYIYANMPEYTEPPIKTPTELVKRALKPTRGKKKSDSVIKTKVKTYKSKSKEYVRLKKLRVELEKARLISSQVLRREKTKTKLEIMNQETFRAEVEKIVGTKLATELFGNDEEDLTDLPSSSKLKKGKNSKENLADDAAARLERLERKFGMLKTIHTPTKIRSKSKSLVEESEMSEEVGESEGSDESEESDESVETEKKSPIKKYSKQKSAQKDSGKVSKIKKLHKATPTSSSSKKKKASSITKQLSLNEEGAEVKRKRGRPRLSDLKPTGKTSKILKKTPQKNSVNKTTEEQPKRKRGRPRKYFPEKVEEEIINDEEEEDEAEDESEEEEEYEDYEEDESEEEEEEESDEEEEYEADEEEEDEEDELDEESLASEPRSPVRKKPSVTKTPTTPTPRKRGRPPLVKKVKKEADSKDHTPNPKAAQSTPKKNKIGPSQINPNEPGDTVSPKAPRLKKELQKIMLGNQDVLPILLSTDPTTRATRSSFSLAKKLGRTGMSKRK